MLLAAHDRGPEAWRRSMRHLVKHRLERWILPDRSRRPVRVEKHAPGEPFEDDRSLLRRGASSAKAIVMRTLRRVRKRVWEAVKRILAWRMLPLDRVHEVAQRRGLRALDEKLYQPNLASFRKDINRTQREVNRLHRSRAPIIVGPWVSEIGFEILYWIPFLYWAKATARLSAERLWVVSRGGCAPWYRHLTPNYLEIFECFEPDEFRARNAQRTVGEGGLKQHGISRFEREIADWAAERIGAYRCQTLHPSVMYRLFRPYFLKKAPIRLVEAFTFYRRIFEAPAPESPAGLPCDYVAVKLYGNLALSDDPATRAKIAGILRSLCAQTNVVLLDSAVRYDDHRAIGLDERDGLYTLEGRLAPVDNLAVQTQVIRNARAFYCTYGGFSYLAPLCGVPTVTFFTNPTAFKPEHLETARRAFEMLDCPPFVLLDLAHLGEIERDLAFLFD